MKKITLTSSQQKALDHFILFLKDTNAKIFILRGYAGTGKTTLTSQFINELEERELPFSLLASTGRAAKILSDVTGHEARTVHGEIYKFIDLNQDLEKIAQERETVNVDSTGQLYLNFELTEKPSFESDDNHFYIIDESSMLSDVPERGATQAKFGTGKILHDLLSYDKKGKFIFIGDICQLPPITQPFSPALHDSYFESEYDMKAYTSELTKIVRQDDTNDIVIAAQKLRKLYYHPQSWKWAKFPLKGYRHIHVLSSQTELINKYISTVKNLGFNAGTLLCSSNRESNMLTQILRPSFGHHTTTLEKGDLLLVTQNNLISGLMNGDLVMVEDVTSQERRAGMTFIHVSVREMFSQQTFSQLLIAEVLYGNLTNITPSQQKDLYVDYYYRMKDKGIKQKSPLFKKGMFTDPYLNALRAVFGYALTCHKAQGGEWDHVFLDIPSYLARREKPQVYQWVYTAITRARKELYIVDGFWLM